MPHVTEHLSISESFNFVQHVSGPTHLKGHTLDLVFSLGLNIGNVFAEDVHLSDHNCVFVELNFSSKQTPVKLKTHRRIITETTAERFSIMFDSSLLFTGNDVNALIQSFNRECTSILDQVAPIKTSSVLQKKTCPWINESILNLRRICRKIERLWKKTKLDAHRLHLRDLMLSLNDTVKTVRSE